MYACSILRGTNHSADEQRLEIASPPPTRKSGAFVVDGKRKDKGGDADDEFIRARFVCDQHHSDENREKNDRRQNCQMESYDWNPIKASIGPFSGNR